MAVGAKTLTFGGVNSADYKVHISGGGTFDVAKRKYETVEIPGRNGSLMQDLGAYENKAITYPAFICETDDETEFRNAISDFRNALGSLIGYQRLEDDYHPDEYRMGVYMSEMEPEPVIRNSKATFDLNFDCKPQRFLKSGETAVTVASGDTLTNPTRFDASPMIMVDGYGDLTVNGYPITINSETMGNITLGQRVASLTIDDHLVNTGDVITVTGMSGSISYESQTNTKRISSVSISDGTTDFPSGSISHYDSSLTSDISWSASDAVTFVKGTAATYTANYSMTMVFSDSTTKTGTLTFRLAYDGANTITARVVPPWAAVASEMTIQTGASMTQVTAVSSKSVLGSPIYIDCDLGICYKIENNSYADLNRYIELGTDLPKLSPGTNEITFDSTYTSVQIIPRWWKL